MTETLIDIDPVLLARAMEVTGASTFAEVIDAALREVIAAAARRRQIERLLDPEPADIDDPAVLAQAWR